MNPHIVLRLFAFVLALSVVPIAAQVQPLQDDRSIEEEFIRQKAEIGSSHASGARDDLGPVILGNPTQAAVAIRVGLSYSFTAAGAYSEFTTRHHPFAEISHTAGTVYLIDRGSGQEVAILDVPGTVVRVNRDAAGYHVSVGGVEVGTYAGPLFFDPTDTTNQFKIEHIRRSPTFGPSPAVPLYRGAIELSHAGGTQTDRLHVVNIVEIEDYVPGVVANESIASFHMDALKAQAVAARGYAIANIGRFRANFPYDIDDSSQSQVYRGVISEHPRAVQSSQETTGLVASYDGRIISALYSSSFGGHSDSNHWIFNSPSSQLPGTNVTPYLTGIYDGEGSAPDLTDPTQLETFWLSLNIANAYDMCGRFTPNNRFSRWRISIPLTEIKTRVLTAGRATVSGDTSGSVTDVQVQLRMTGSNRIAIAQAIFSSGGTATVRGWDNMRWVFGRTQAAQPSICGGTNIPASFTLTNPSLVSISDTNVIAEGGGWGHNTGMSQYGAHGRGLAGQTFLQILKAYYTGVDIGSYPIRIGREPGTGPPTLRQEFYAPNGLGTLKIRNATFKGLNIHINGTYDIILRADQLADGAESIDLSPYLQQGLNMIQYNVVGRTGSATVNVNVE